MMEHANRPHHARPIELFGLKFPTAVGLAAGMDKNADMWRAASAFGFGHVEIGTVTAQEQGGNMRPRLFRFRDDEALINRMGFNNKGAEAVAAVLKKSRAGGEHSIPLGINIGKSKTTPLDRAAEDYLHSFNTLADYADYFTLNVSSPNTPELRKLQGSAYLPSLLGELREASSRRARKLGVKPVPLLLKIAPDLTFREIDDILAIAQANGIDGIIATNTTLARPGRFAQVSEAGGLSGRPLFRKSLEVVNYITAPHRGASRDRRGRHHGGAQRLADDGRRCAPGADLHRLGLPRPFFPRDLAMALAPRHSSWI
jgi:dihydroorotate dehydrogenase